MIHLCARYVRIQRDISDRCPHTRGRFIPVRVGVLSNWVVWVCVWQAIIGAVAGVLLPSDFPQIVAALGSEEDKARLALLLQEVDVLQVDFEKEQGIHSEEEIKALQERREEAARLRKNISEAKSQLGSASWLDAQHFWQVTQEVDFVNACQDRLNELETQLDSNTGAAWENLQAGLERIKNLAVKCMVVRVYFEKRRGIIPALLAKFLDGICRYGVRAAANVAIVLSPCAPAAKLTLLHYRHGAICRRNVDGNFFGTSKTSFPKR